MHYRDSEEKIVESLGSLASAHWWHLLCKIFWSTFHFLFSISLSIDKSVEFLVSNTLAKIYRFLILQNVLGSLAHWWHSQGFWFNSHFFYFFIKSVELNFKCINQDLKAEFDRKSVESFRLVGISSLAAFARFFRS